MSNRPLIFVTAALVVAFAFVANSHSPALAQGGQEITNGIIVGVATDDNGGLLRIAVSNSGGTITEFDVSPETEFGLESQTGDRWNSTIADDPVEAVTRLRDHQQRFTAITVTSENGVALSVVDKEEGRLETNLSYLFAVFAITWAGFFAYIFFISRKQRELQKQVARLQARLESRKSDE